MVVSSSPFKSSFGLGLDFGSPCLAFVVVGFVVVEIIEVAWESEEIELVREYELGWLLDEGVGGFDEEDELGVVTPRRFKNLLLGNPDRFLDGGSR
ncbi:hypothetical protein Tco_0097267 [Tanacetum coccineum]